jgi:hypothetical protein
MSTRVLIPSLNRFVKPAVATVSTRSMICPAVKYLPNLDGVEPRRQALGKFDGSALLFTERVAYGPNLFFERLDPFVGHALPLRRSGVSAASILAAVSLLTYAHKPASSPWWAACLGPENAG